ncbi:MAG TPA: hypothetical protein VMB27_06740 [Solirubrobacteraceae bacterium]|nr:hypothetical protein [Solirubrobacteraceae bacterium]
MKRLWRVLAFLAATGAALFLSTAAFAVGAGSSPPQAQWKVNRGPATWSGKLTALYPGAPNDTERFTVTIVNRGRSAQILHSVTASIATTAAAGCRTSWFTVAVRHERPLPARIASGASYIAQVGLAMRNSGTNQDACRRASPAFTITAR